MSFSKTFYLATAAVVCGLGAPNAASAQSAQSTERAAQSATLEEVIVTARRTEENLQDVPVAVTAVSGAMLRAQNITQTSDLQRIAPSLMVTNTLRGAAYPTYSIRGQRSAYTPTPLSDPSVGLYFADFTMAQGLGSNSSLYDLSSVQVLKGPQGTLFGRNTTGGAILFTPNAPTDRFEGYIQGALGDYNFRDLEGVVNIPLGDKAALRVGGKIIRRDGYTHNVLNGQDTDDRDAESMRVSLRLSPTEGVESTFIGRFVRDDSTHAYKLYQPSPVGLALTAGPALGPIGAGLVQAEMAKTRAMGRYDYRSNRSLWASARNWAIQNTTTVDLGGGFTFKNIAGYSRSRAGTVLDWDGSPVEIFATDLGRTRNKFYSEEAQILGKLDKLDFVAGAYYYHSSDAEGSTSNILGLLSPIVPVAFPILSATQFSDTSRSFAVFLHANYDLGDMIEGLSASGGVRYTSDRKTVDWRNVSGGGNPARYRCTVGGAPLTSPAPNQICSVTKKISFREPTWDVSLNYKPNDQILLYAAHHHGYRAGGFNSAPQVGIPDSFSPEKINDVEFGLKSDFDAGGMPVRFNLAGYHSWYKNIQRSVGRVIPATGSINQVMMNAASATILGGEAELTVKLTPSLTVIGGYAYTKPKYKSWTDVYSASGLPGAPIVTIDISDSDFAFISKHQFNLSVEWQLPVPASYGEISARVGMSGVSSFVTQEISTANCGPDGRYGSCLFRLGRLPAYAVANARVDWRGVAGSNVDMAFFVNNLADTFYRPDSVNAMSLGFQSTSVGAPRMFGVEVRVPFGG